MLCCGSGSEFGKVLVPAPAPIPDPDKISHSFPITKIFHKTLPFQSWPLIYDFLTYVGRKVLLKGIKLGFLFVNFGQFP
jgi:hypothetical protein